MTKVHWLQRATLWTAFLVSVQPHSVQKRVSWSPQPCVLVWSLKRLSELLSVSFRALLSLTTNYKRSKMFSCLICDLHEFCPNPVVKPAEEVGEQSIMQFPPWLVLHSEQFVFFTFQEIQSLEWGDYAGITSIFFKEKKIYSSHDFIGNLGSICWNDLQVRRKIVY